MLSSRVTFAQHPRSPFASSPINATPASFIFVQPLCFQTLAHSFARRKIRIFFFFNYFRTLFITTGGIRHSSHFGTHPPRSIHLSFQRLTHDPFCKSFPLIYIHLMGGVWGGHMVTENLSIPDPRFRLPHRSLCSPSFCPEDIRLGYTLSSGGAPVLEVAKSILLILSALFPIVNPL